MQATLTDALAQIRHSGNRPAIALGDLDQKVESQCLFKKMNEVVADFEDIRIIKPLDFQNRILTTREKDDPSHFMICLQTFHHGQWHTVLSYEYNRGRGMRALFGARGRISGLFIDLPRNVILEMASEDVKRNWMDYTAHFVHSNRVERSEKVVSRPA